MTGKTAIVLLHGIGDQEQGATLRDFQLALKRAGYTGGVDDPTLRHVRTSDEKFRYFHVDSQINDKKVNISEFYWADLSRVSTGFAATLRNFVRLAVDAPDIIYACLGPRISDGEYIDYFILRCLRASLALSLWAVYFPVIALNLSYAVVVAGFAINVGFNHGVTLASPAAPTVLITSLAAVSIASILLRFLHQTHARAFAAMVLVVFLVLLGLGTTDMLLLSDSRPFQFYSEIFNVALVGLWIVAFAGSTLYLVLLPFLLLFFRKRWRGILLGFATAFLVLRFWLLLITTVWLIYLNQVFDKQIYNALLDQISRSLQLIGLVWFDLAVIGILLGASFALYLRQSYSNREQLTGRRYPRLIVPMSVLIVTVALTGVWIASLASCIAKTSVIIPMSLCNKISESTEFIVWYAAPILFVGGVLVQFLHSGFEVSNDIVNYFKSNRGHRRILPWVALRTVFNYRSAGTLEFRQVLHDRLNWMIADLDRSAGPFDKAIFVAHSLGSIIFIDIARLDEPKSGDAVPTALVTMGSPYQTIFRHYFPHMFAPAGLQNLELWTNIYYENDYVGTAMTSPGSNVIEQPLPPRGHLGYFSDEDALAVIIRRI